METDRNADLLRQERELARHRADIEYRRREPYWWGEEMLRLRLAVERGPEMQGEEGAMTMKMRSNWSKELRDYIAFFANAAAAGAIGVLAEAGAMRAARAVAVTKFPGEIREQMVSLLATLDVQLKNYVTVTEDGEKPEGA